VPTISAKPPARIVRRCAVADAAPDRAELALDAFLTTFAGHRRFVGASASPSRLALRPLVQLPTLGIAVLLADRVEALVQRGGREPAWRVRWFPTSAAACPQFYGALRICDEDGTTFLALDGEHTLPQRAWARPVLRTLAHAIVDATARALLVTLRDAIAERESIRTA
jgi:hypothetical protein